MGLPDSGHLVGPHQHISDHDSNDIFWQFLVFNMKRERKFCVWCCMGDYDLGEMITIISKYTTGRVEIGQCST